MFAKKKGLARRAGPPVHDDLVAWRFTAAGPNQPWLTDITEHPTGEGKLYLRAVKDVHSGRIVGYSMDHHMKASLAVGALRNAVALRRPSGTLVRSDRGSIRLRRARGAGDRIHRNEAAAVSKVILCP